MKSHLTLLFFVLLFAFTLTSNTSAEAAEDLQFLYKIERYTSTMSEVSVRQYLKNIENYEGFRLAAIEIEAGALNEFAIVNVFIKETQQGRALQLGQDPLKFLIFPDSDFFIGQGAEEIKLLAVNPSYIKNIKLILSR